MGRQDLRERVRRVAERTLAEQQYVRPIDVLLGLGWLAPSNLDRWRQGRVPYLELEIQAGLGKVATAMGEVRRWAREGTDAVGDCLCGAYPRPPAAPVQR